MVSIVLEIFLISCDVFGSGSRSRTTQLGVTSPQQQSQTLLLQHLKQPKMLENDTKVILQTCPDLSVFEIRMPASPSSTSKTESHLRTLPVTRPGWRASESKHLAPRRRIRFFWILLSVLLTIASPIWHFWHRFNTPIGEPSQAVLKVAPPPTVAIVVIATSEKPFMYRSLSTIQRYAARHGYPLHLHLGLETIPNVPAGTPAVWAKFPAMLQAMDESDKAEKLGLPQSEWIWMLDMDVLVMSSDRKLEEFLPGFPAFDAKFLDENGTDIRSIGEKERDDGAQIVVAQDCNHINFGSSFWRNSEYSRQLISEIFDTGRNDTRGSWKENEQGMFQKFLDQNIMGTADHVRLANQWDINA